MERRTWEVWGWVPFAAVAFVLTVVAIGSRAWAMLLVGAGLWALCLLVVPHRIEVGPALTFCYVLRPRRTVPLDAVVAVRGGHSWITLVTRRGEVIVPSWIARRRDFVAALVEGNPAVDVDARLR